MHSRVALVILRLYLGVIFAVAALPKIQAGAALPRMIAGFLEHTAMQQAQPFYRSFVADVVLPHLSIVAPVIVAGEAYVAIAMLIGLTTRAASVVAMLLLANYMLAKGMWWFEPASNDAALFVAALAVLIGAAGRTAGIDALLAKRWARNPLW